MVVCRPLWGDGDSSAARFPVVRFAFRMSDGDDHDISGKQPKDDRVGKSTKNAASITRIVLERFNESE